MPYDAQGGRFRMKKWLIVISVLACLVSFSAQAQEFGDFSALKMDKEVVDEVLPQGNDIYVKINQAHWDAAFQVKISDENQSGYRKWSSGEDEMTVKVYQSQKENRQGYTYRINTAAKYVEYWMDGKLVLHLERRS
jgi:hypothetical protein